MSGAEFSMDRTPARRSDEGRTAERDFRREASDARSDLQFAQLMHRFDLFEYKLLSTIDRRLCQQAWMTMWALLVAMAVIIAAARL